MAKKTSHKNILPNNFLFGVATSGYQVEGGYNGPGEPANNWKVQEDKGKIEPSGIAVDFWNRYEEQLDYAQSLGINSFRMSIEWTRCQPEPGVTDNSALEHYGKIIDACKERGMEPLLTLEHFTHPLWLGEHLWLDDDSPQLFKAWVDTAVKQFSDRCSLWVTINEINIVALMTYLFGLFSPSGELQSIKGITNIRHVYKALDNMLTAHVLAYQAIHDLQPHAKVTTNSCSFTLYELDRFLIDVLLLRQLGVAKQDAKEWIQEQRRKWYAKLPATHTMGIRVKEDVFRRLAHRFHPYISALPKTIEAVYESPYDKTLDAVGIDYYDPVIGNSIKLPGHATAGERNFTLRPMLWDSVPDPAGLTTFCEINTVKDLDVWVVENGLCNRVKKGRAYQRLDGWDRPRYLRENLAGVVAGIESGIPITGYWHWSLVDNYEWGSYEPRFGIFGIDRERGVRWKETDSMGNDSRQAYRDIIQGLRKGDLSVVRHAL